MGIILGPMEGISDGAFKATILELFPEWDFVAGEFLRAPSHGHFKDHFIIDFFGKRIFENAVWKQKSIFQILTSPQALYVPLVQQIRELGFSWLDLNLGCPSRVVNNHFGGAKLLEFPDEMKRIVHTIREHFPKPLTFSVKMRLGYHDIQNFESNVAMLVDAQVDYITVHGRTRDQLYNGIADWSPLEKVATKYKNVMKFIGNGDIWNIDQYKEKQNTQLYSHIMLSRPALKYPWFPRMLNFPIKDAFDMYCYPYYKHFANELAIEGLSGDQICKRMKAVSRYIFDDLENGQDFKKTLFRIQDLDTFLDYVKANKNNKVYNQVPRDK